MSKTIRAGKVLIHIKDADTIVPGEIEMADDVIDIMQRVKRSSSRREALQQAQAGVRYAQGLVSSLQTKR